MIFLLWCLMTCVSSDWKLLHRHGILQSSLDWILWYTVRYELWLSFSTFIPLRVLLWDNLAVLFRSILHTSYLGGFLSRVTSDLLDVLQGRSSGRKFCHSHLHLWGFSPVCPLMINRGRIPDWMPSHSHCVCRDWISLHYAFLMFAEASVLEIFPHSKHTWAPLPYEWTAADCVLWGHWSLIHPTTF